MRQICTVKYQVATYSGNITVYCDEDDSTDYVIAKAKRLLKVQSRGSLPFGYQSFTITSRTSYHGL